MVVKCLAHKLLGQSGFSYMKYIAFVDSLIHQVFVAFQSAMSVLGTVHYTTPKQKKIIIAVTENKLVNRQDNVSYSIKY